MSNYGDIMNAMVTRLKAQLTYLNSQVYPIHERVEVFKYKGMPTPFILIYYTGGPITDGTGYEDQQHGFGVMVYKHGWDKRGANTYKSITGSKTIPDIIEDAKGALDLYDFSTELPNYIYYARAIAFNPSTSTAALNIPDEYYHNAGGFRMNYYIEKR